MTKRSRGGPRGAQDTDGRGQATRACYKMGVRYKMGGACYKMGGGAVGSLRGRGMMGALGGGGRGMMGALGAGAGPLTELLPPVPRHRHLGGARPLLLRCLQQPARGEGGVGALSTGGGRELWGAGAGPLTELLPPVPRHRHLGGARPLLLRCLQLPARGEGGVGALRPYWGGRSSGGWGRGLSPSCSRRYPATATSAARVRSCCVASSSLRSFVSSCCLCRLSYLSRSFCCSTLAMRCRAGSGGVVRGAAAAGRSGPQPRGANFELTIRYFLI